MRIPRVRLPRVSQTAPTGSANGQVYSTDDPGSTSAIYSEQATDPVHSTVLYTPDKRFKGTDTFTYTATDGQTESAPATVTIQVTASKPKGG
jgi:large repetitive protein